jgi:hypothetical protein
MSDASEKARRRAARELVGDYRERELEALLEHVRDGFARIDAVELDAFELDDLIHRYKRSARGVRSRRAPGGSPARAPRVAAHPTRTTRRAATPRRTALQPDNAALHPASNTRSSV